METQQQPQLSSIPQTSQISQTLQIPQTSQISQPQPHPQQQSLLPHSNPLLPPLQFDPPTQIQLHQDLTSSSLCQQIKDPLYRTYSKHEFTTILTQLSHTDPLYTIDPHSLSMIYDKTIQHEGHFTGNQLAEFAQVLKERNKDRFHEEVNSYREYIKRARDEHKGVIKSKELLDYLYERDQIGFLTDCVYEVLSKEEEVSVRKLEGLLDQVENNFTLNQQLSMPKKVSLKKSTYYSYQNYDHLDPSQYSQPLQQQGNDSPPSYQLSDPYSITPQTLHSLMLQILPHITSPALSTHIQQQFHTLSTRITHLTQHTLPSLRQQTVFLTKCTKSLEQQLQATYQQLESKSNELVEARNAIMELTEENMKLGKEVISRRIEVNEREEEVCLLLQVKGQLQRQLIKEKQEREGFFREYQALKGDYQRFVEGLKLKEEQERLVKQQSTPINLFPTLSLKQQLQDAQFKIRRLKQQKTHLLTDLENHQTAYVARIDHLERQLEEARNNANRTEQLKMTGMSRLSKNFEAIRESYYNGGGSKRSVFGGKRSVFQSVVSVMGRSNWKPTESEKINDNNQHNTNSKKMSVYLNEVQDYMKHSSTKNLNHTKFNQHGTRSNKGTPKEQQNQQKEQAQFQNPMQASFYRESRKDQPKYNFCDMNYDQLRKKWQQENPTILGEDEQPLQQQQQEEVNQQQPNLSLKSQQPPSLQPSTSQNLPNPTKQPKPETVFLSSCQILSKSGSRYKKHIMFNRKGMYLFDTKLRLEKEMKWSKILKVTFTYYNTDCFVISFKRKQSPMKKRIVNNQSDIIFRCLKTKQLLSFLSQPTILSTSLNPNKVRILTEKQQNIWLRQSTADKEQILSNCSNFYNPFRLTLSLKNHHNNFFYAQLSRQNFFSRSYIIICLVQESGVYCFEWTQDQMEREKRFVYLLPLVKRMLFVREVETAVVKLVYEDWSDGKTFLLRFKNPMEGLKFETVCKERVKLNLQVLSNRKKLIEDTFCKEENQINLSVDNSNKKLDLTISQNQ